MILQEVNLKDAVDEYTVNHDALYIVGVQSAFTEWIFL